MNEAAEELAVENLAKRYPAPQGEYTVLEGVSLTVRPAETVAIVGPSGSGKSTFLNLVGALDRPTSGSIRLGSIEVTKLEGRALAEYRARRAGFIFQDHHLLPQLTALENLLLPTLAAGRRPDDEARARKLLERLGVAARADSFPARMSGGERQRVAVARALINGARLLLCDEPTGNLDRETGELLAALLLELAGRDGVTVLMVTHNLALAERFGRVLELRERKFFPAGARKGG
jgi:lipoprotein-releasing system ATP-binding protein